jgi:outer membrane protein assembly factor BamD
MYLKSFMLPLLAVIFLLSSCSRFGKVLKSKDYDYKLAMANEYYDKGKYKYSLQLFEELFPVFKGSQKFEELYYKYAYCFYHLKMYRDAENLFKGYLEVFPNSARAEEVDFLRAYCFHKESPKLELEQSNTFKSMSMMQTFISTHPGSAHNKEAEEIIEQARIKLENKEYRAAKLYYDMGRYRASALAFADILNSYPESAKGEEYMLMVVKSYYRFADLSITEKQMERYEKVVTEYREFADRFPESKLLREAEELSIQSQKYIKSLQNEQNTPSAKL